MPKKLLLSIIALGSLACFVSLITPSESVARSALEITQAWSPEAPPGRTMAGFMTISNTGNVPIKLVDGYSVGFGRIEIHDMINDDGVMRMRRLDSLTVEANATVQLRPGSYHVMLMEPKETYVANDRIPLTLVDDQNREYEITLTVRSR